MAGEALPFGDDTYVVRDVVYESLVMILMYIYICSMRFCVRVSAGVLLYNCPFSRGLANI